MAATFRGILQHDSGMFVEVPPEIVQSLGAGKRPAVWASVNGVAWRTTVAVYGGRAYIGLRREIQEAAQVAPGESIEVSVEPDDQPRSVDVPPDLAAVLAADPEASSRFEGLSFTHRNEYVRWITDARRPATRQKRLAETPALLKSGRRTPDSR